MRPSRPGSCIRRSRPQVPGDDPDGEPMSVFAAADFDHHETVAFFDDEASGLRSIIAIHSTALGPACGGCRMYPYPDDDAALTDVLRLARGMSYKSAIANLPLGGGKAVIIGNPARDKTEAKLLAFAEAVNALGGRYITAMDVGMTQADMPVIARATRHVAGYDQPGKTGGNSGPMTALGVYAGMKAAARHKLGTDSLKGLRIAVQGLGKVGMNLAGRLHADGAVLVVADVSAEAVRIAEAEFGARATTPVGILSEACDIFSPNALGAVLNERSIAGLQAKIVAGAANNQLARDADGEALKARGILYAPDYVINGGGIICVAGQIFGWSDREIETRTRAIADTLSLVFTRADRENAATNVVADRIARERMADARKRGTPAVAAAG